MFPIVTADLSSVDSIWILGGSGLGLVVSALILGRILRSRTKGTQHNG